MRALIAGLATGLVSAHSAAAPCLPTDGMGDAPRVVATRRSATVCVPDKCVAVTPTSKPKTVRTPPVTAEKRVAQVKRAAGKWSVCIAGRCKAVGAKLATALASSAASPPAYADMPRTPQATDDGAVVAFGTEVWAVATDSKLDLKAPKEYADQGGGASLVAVRIAGKAIVADWTDCAGPCGTSVLVDVKGGNLGPRFGTGVLMPLDPGRLAVLSTEPDNELLVIDVASGNPMARLPIDMGGVTPAGAAKVDPSTVVVAYLSPDGWVVGYYATPAGKPITAGATYRVAACAD